MIWILDKVIQAMRQVLLGDSNSDPGSPLRLAPTFENIDLGPRDQAFATLKNLCDDLNTRYGNESWYNSDLQYYIQMIPSLPDVSSLWVQALKPQPGCNVDQYAGVPKYPAHPPKTVGEGEVRHACMGLNHCAGQGRTRDNACAGQGYCSTALQYNYNHPKAPLISDHTCHVLNACQCQGGCGMSGAGSCS